MKENHSSFFLFAFIYLCGYLLFLEWIYPIQMFDRGIIIGLFVIYGLYCFAISLLRLRWGLSIVLKGIGTLFILIRLYIEDSQGLGEFFRALGFEWRLNIQWILEKNWYILTGSFRTFLFLLLIWLMSYLIYYWFVTMQRVFVFAFLTIVYIGILDTFTLYDGKIPMIRAVLISFVILGTTKFLKLTKDRKVFVKNRVHWLGIVLTFALLSVLIGYLAPTYEAKWSDPVPYLKNITAGEGKGESKSGFRENDEELGGSFTFDHTPLFQATVLRNHYWRMETKDYYTGKGWIQSEEVIHSLGKGSVSHRYRTFIEEVAIEPSTAYVGFYDQFIWGQLAYPYGLHFIRLERNEELLFDPMKEAITKADELTFSGETIEMHYDHPRFDEEMLRNDTTEVPEQLIDRYTQVPDDLPERIYELAKQITEPFQNQYDQVKAIERYFHMNDFQYETDNIPYPSEGQDYVDQFLFETRRGYCDNFSTSMVVMLRTLGIPARWVKGFTGGDALDQTVVVDDETYHLYEVTNAHAHSWVEVLFLGVGWVPFEPTKGFSNTNVRLAEDPEDIWENEEAIDWEENDETVEELETPPVEDEVTAEEIEENKEKHKASQPFQMNQTIKTVIRWALFLLIIGCLFLLYRYWPILQTAYYRRRMEKSPSIDSYQKAYIHLLQLLEGQGFIKKRHETLREFAKKIDEAFETDEMIFLTKLYEKMIYHTEDAKDLLEDVIERWEQLVQKIMKK